MTPAQQEQLRQGLLDIAAWKMPRTGKYHEQSGIEMSWAWCYGSQGEKQVIQEKARELLALLDS